MTDQKPDPTVSEYFDDGALHTVKAFIAALLGVILGYLIALLALFVGFALGGAVLGWSIFDSWVLAVAASIALGWVLSEIMPISEDQIRTSLFGMQTVEATRRRRGKRHASKASSDRAESALRERLTKMGARPKSHPPPDQKGSS